MLSRGGVGGAPSGELGGQAFCPPWGRQRPGPVPALCPASCHLLPKLPLSRGPRQRSRPSQCPPSAESPRSSAALWPSIQWPLHAHPAPHVPVPSRKASALSPPETLDEWPGRPLPGLWSPHKLGAGDPSLRFSAIQSPLDAPASTEPHFPPHPCTLWWHRVSAHPQPDPRGPARGRGP